MFKKLVLFSVSVFLLGSCTLFRKSASNSLLNTFSTEENKEIVQASKQFLGIPYRNGGMDLDGMDCSGFLYNLYAGNSFVIPRTTGLQMEFGYPIEKSTIEIGDWLFFKTNGAAQINHVGLVTQITSKNILFIHASTSKGIREDDLYQSYWTRSFVKALRPFKR